MFTFAISNPCNIPEIKTIVKQVKTKRWANQHTSKLDKYRDLFTNAGRDNRQVTGGMLHAAYGVNIGEQVLAQLTDDNLIVIRSNILA